MKRKINGNWYSISGSEIIVYGILQEKPVRHIKLYDNKDERDEDLAIWTRRGIKSLEIKPIKIKNRFTPKIIEDK